MSVRIDSPARFGVVVGNLGCGVLAENISAHGESGYPSIAYPWLGPEDAGKEIRVQVTSPPAVGSLFVYEDTSFDYAGPSTSFEVQLYVDGVPVGEPQAVTITSSLVETTVEPGTGSAVRSGRAPDVERGAAVTVWPSAGGTLRSGYTPAVVIGSATEVAPAAGRSLQHGNAPDVSRGAGIDVRPTRGEIERRGHVASIEQSRTITPSSGRCSARSFNPIVHQLAGRVIEPVKARRVSAGGAPAIVQGRAIAITPSPAHVAHRGKRPEVRQIDLFAPGFVPSARFWSADDALARAARVVAR